MKKVGREAGVLCCWGSSDIRRYRRSEQHENKETAFTRILLEDEGSFYILLFLGPITKAK
jgi:hypothetical protein